VICEALAGEFREHDVGARAKERLDKIRNDKELQKNFASEKAFAGAWDTVLREGFDKAKKKLEQVVADHPGTPAADRARAALGQ
jgi:hypothetical protein